MARQMKNTYRGQATNVKNNSTDYRGLCNLCRGFILAKAPILLTTIHSYTMKKWKYLLGFCALTFLNFLAMAQKTDYDKLWNKVKTLTEQNLPKSAMAEVNTIYTQAKAEKNDAQLIKALVKKSQLVQQVEEDNWKKTVLDLEKEIESTTGPARQILYTITAGAYRGYYNAVRWNLEARTNTVGLENTDPETWTAGDFHKKIAALYQASLKPQVLLQQTDLQAYEPILLKGNQRALRPTLFDLLAHEALAYFTTDENGLSSPANAFELNDAASLAEPSAFANVEYKSADNSSNVLKTIQLYQSLTQFHLSNSNADALLDLTASRLQYAYKNNTNPRKDDLYKATLQQLYNSYSHQPQIQDIGYLLANWWYQKGSAYQPETGTMEDKMAFAEALRLAKAIGKKYAEGEGASNARNLAAKIEQSDLNLVAEKVNLPLQPFRALLSFKNAPMAYLRLVAITPQVEVLLNRSNRYQPGFWDKLTAQKALRNWQQALPSTQDYRLHSAEIKIDGLPVGKYLLLASTQADFKANSSPLVATVVYTSNISYVKNGDAYYLLHRNTGMPLENASVQLWESNYDYNLRSNKKTKNALLTTNRDGFVSLKTTATSGNSLLLDIRWRKDRLFLDEEEYHYRSTDRDPNTNPEDEHGRVQYFFFLDRSIYRPGQQLHFKAVGVSKHQADVRSTAYVPKAPLTVMLRNANGELVDSLSIAANAFGSVAGKFSLPMGGLTGQFSLVIKHQKLEFSKAFEVEEYKRPKFYINFDTLKNAFKLNSQITVSGKAKAYAGNAIDGATVKYRVYRTTRFENDWLFWGRGGRPQPNRADKELAAGQTTTAADGSFNVAFTAVPDLSVDSRLEPTFDYVVTTDITDANGETRSSETIVSIGYKSLIMNLKLPGGLWQDADALPALNVAINNLAAVPQAAAATINIYPLKAPNRLIKPRYWAAPDTAVMDYAAFVKLFPNDAYANDDQYQSWEKAPLLTTLSVQSNASGPASLKLPVLAAGWYMLEARTTDAEGQAVTAVCYAAVYSSKMGKLPSPTYYFEKPLQNSTEPGNVASFMQASSASNLFVVQEVVKPNDETKTALTHTTLQSVPSAATFAVAEADRGGFAVNRFFVLHNRVYTSRWAINVPWSNKALTIGFGTFRNLLLPGQNETWTVNIAGQNKEAVAAEMVASMYDASLDQFAPHQWQQPSIWPTNYLANGWQGSHAFGIAESQQMPVYPPMQFFRKTYDQLVGVSGGGDRLMGTPLRMTARAKNDDMMIEEISGNFTAPKIAADTDADGVADSMDYRLQKEIGDGQNPVKKPSDQGVQVRKNFNETAFFFPQLLTDAQGNISFSFTMPEALTQWKLQTFAHTKELQMGMASQTVVTQKELMVQPFAPRFLRQNDTLQFSTKVVNLSNTAVEGAVSLQLFDSETMAPLDLAFGNQRASQSFSIAPGQSQPFSFAITIPNTYNGAVTYRLIAKTAAASDGEEMALPVLTNRQLVTESFPLNLRNTNEKTFLWQRLNTLNPAGNANTSIKNHALTVEFTSNPAWYAVQALPYLMEYPHDCAEQTWSRFYANALASHIALSTPRIAAVFSQWKNSQPEALMSNLQKNQELKAVLLEESPWVLDGQSEAQQKQNIGLLFDMVRMGKEAEKALRQLAEMQSSNDVLFLL
ncbi:MAG: alpha-2-macroglobulin, partial [Bacteroidetes bacterium]